MGNIKSNLRDFFGNLLMLKGRDEFYSNGIGYRMISKSKHRVVVSDSHLEAKGNLVIPSTVRRNGRVYTVWGMTRGAFSERHHLRSICLPRTVFHVSEQAFEGCDALIKVDLPPSISKVKEDAFHDCFKLRLVRVRAPLPPEVERLAFDNVPMKLLRLEVPAESVERYRATEGWKEFGEIAALRDE